MIYYIYLTGAAFAFSMQFIMQKLYQTRVKPSLLTSLFFSLVTNAVSAVLFFAVGGFTFKFSLFSFVIAGIMAVCIILVAIASIKVLSMGRISVYSLFMMLGGMILPFLYGIFALKEEITVNKIIGIILLAVSLFLPRFDNKKDGKKSGILFYLLCASVFVLNGACGVICKAHQINISAIPTANYISLYCFIAFIVSLIAVTVILINDKNRNEDLSEIKKACSPVPLLSCAGYTIINNTGNFLLLLSAKEVAASLQYPFITGGTIILSAITGFLFYRERLKKFTAIGIILSLIATILFVF